MLSDDHAAGAEEPAITRDGDAASRAIGAAWRETGGLGDSPYYDALLGTPSWRERLVSAKSAAAARIADIGAPVLVGGALAAAASAVLFWLAGDPRETLYRADAATREVTLSDRSVVALSPGAELAFVDGDHRRDARLTGGARFAIAHDAARPFTIHTGDAKVRVLGTRFDLEYAGRCTQLSVIEGRVAFSRAGRPLRQLVAGEQSVIADRTARPGACVTIAGQPGRLSYADGRLDTIVGEISACHARPVTIAPGTLGNLRVTTSFTLTQVDQMLATLPKILPVRLIRSADGAVQVVPGAPTRRPEG